MGDVALRSAGCFVEGSKRCRRHWRRSSVKIVRREERSETCRRCQDGCELEASGKYGGEHEHLEMLLPLLGSASYETGNLA
jgi:hypothetical protein